MAKKTNPNMALWEAVCKSDPKTLREFNTGRFSGTAIDPQAQRKRATEMFGPYGIGWGIDPESEQFKVANMDSNNPLSTLVTYRATLWYKWGEERGEIPIGSDKAAFSSKGKLGSDFTKILRTDAMTKGLSELGFNSDVFENQLKFDGNKYTSLEKENKSAPAASKSMDPPPDWTPPEPEPEPEPEPAGPEPSGAEDSFTLDAPIVPADESKLMPLDEYYSKLGIDPFGLWEVLSETDCPRADQTDLNQLDDEQAQWVENNIEYFKKTMTERGYEVG